MRVFRCDFFFFRPVDLRPNKRGIFARVTACHITLHYYMGFAYFASERYVDAIKALSSIVLYLHSTNKQHHTHSYAYVRYIPGHRRCA